MTPRFIRTNAAFRKRSVGTTAVVLLPTAQAPADSHALSAGVASPTGPKRVLVAEDEEGFMATGAGQGNQTSGLEIDGPVLATRVALEGSPAYICVEHA